MVKTRSTLIMDADLWKRFKMIAILNEMEVSELVEQALREKLERMKQLEQYPEYKEVEGLRVQHRQPQQKRQLPTYQEIKEYHNKVTNELKSEKFTVDKNDLKAHEALTKFIKNIADERNIDYLNAMVLIWNDDNLYQELSDKLGPGKKYGLEILRFEAAIEIMREREKQQQQPQSREKEKASMHHTR